MDFDLKKLNPWNWFKKEQEHQQASRSVPGQSSLPAPQGGSGLLGPMVQMHRDIDRLFTDVFQGFGVPGILDHRSSPWGGVLHPALDIQELEKQYRITVEVPGVDEKDIQVTVENDMLLVRGEKRQTQDRVEGGAHRIERMYGSFQRVLNLPDDADPDAVQAGFKNGVLTLTINKRAAATAQRGRVIPIN